MAKKQEDSEDAASALVELTKLRDGLRQAARTIAAADLEAAKAERIVKGVLSGKLRLAVVRTGDRRRAAR